MPIHKIWDFSFLKLIVDVLPEVMYVAQKLYDRLRSAGLYEVLDFQASLEICDAKGKASIYRKHQKIKFLQNNVISYQDQAFGDGEQFADYEVSPGKAVDRYRDGAIWRVLISLRETKSRGQVEEINIKRTIKNAYYENTCYLQTNIDHPTQSMTMSVIFPADRLPRRVLCVQKNAKRTKELAPENIVDLVDKCQKVTWHVKRPRLFERYLLQWEW